MADVITDSGQNDTDSASADDQTLDTSTLLNGGDAGDAGDAADQDKDAGDNAGDKDDSGDESDAGDNKDGDDGADEVPESYDFQMPEGMEMDAELADAVSPILKEIGATQAQAQKLADALAASRKADADALAQAQEDHFAQQLDDWAEELKTDSEIGGEKFGENAKIAADTIKAFGSPELAEMLNETGFGNNPALFKFVLKVGKALPTQEDQPGHGNAANGEPAQELRLYEADGSPKKR